jgi:endonuclease/exonuclease/phosphatase family metal-dependent hydrolase
LSRDSRQIATARVVAAVEVPARAKAGVVAWQQGSVEHMTPADTPSLGLATWNIHRTRDAQGRCDARRIVRLIAGDARLGGADILSLHEAEQEQPPYAGFPELAALGAATGLHSVHAQAGTRWGADSQGFLGTILMLRAPLAADRVHLVDLPGHYPRGAVVADVTGGPVPFRVVATHLSLLQALRMVQMRTLAQLLHRLPPLPLVVMGDLNEWRPWGGWALHRRIAGRPLHGTACATFPARAALLPLDRILCDQPHALHGTTALRDAPYRLASDHLPLIARLSLQADRPRGHIRENTPSLRTTP